MSCCGSRNSPLVGQVPTLELEFFSTGGVLADPSTIVVQVRAPNGTPSTYTAPDATIDKQSTGVYLFTLPSAYDQPGTWYFHVDGDGAVSQYTQKVRATEYAVA